MHKPVFISWSGQESHPLAIALHQWLPHFIQSVKPWMSSTDILAGSRWQTEIAGKLDACTFGVICVTPQNVERPWLLFEAGALSKSIKPSRVCPLLLGVEAGQLPEALAQFQAVQADEPGIRSLLHSLNDSLEEDKLDDVQLESAFEKFYPDLERDLAAVRNNVANLRETRFRVIQSPLDRTKAIVKDLVDLKTRIRSGSEKKIYVRYSGYLSPFAISETELAFRSKEGSAKQTVAYYDQLRRERDLMIELASDDRFVVRSIITPPTKSAVPYEILEHTKMRLAQLQEFLRDKERPLNIDWAISRFQQKNTYIIGDVSYFEGFKQGAEEGYRFTLRYAGTDEVEINTTMYDELFHRLEMLTLSQYPPTDAGFEYRDGLREATLRCVTEALKEIETADSQSMARKKSVKTASRKRG